MELATVVGACTATTKDGSLQGRKLALVRRVDADGKVVGELEAAIDITSAGVGATVLLARGSAVRQRADTRSAVADLAIVAIVDDIDVPDAPRHPNHHRPARGAKHV